MARALSEIFGTEKDRVNCPFFFKTGACLYGETCARLHNRPTSCRLLLFKHMYHTPLQLAAREGQTLPPELQRKAQEHFENFYLDALTEMERFGDVDEIIVVRNLSSHFFGNTYVQFRTLEAAEAAKKALQGRLYDGQPLEVEFSPVADLDEAECIQSFTNECSRGADCNFMHVHSLPDHVFEEFHGHPHPRKSRGAVRSRHHPSHGRRRDRSPPPRHSSRDRRFDRPRYHERDSHERDYDRRDSRRRDPRDRDSDRDVDRYRPPSARPRLRSPSPSRF